jgi:23S rRNA pseudouridine955/2504/2580 synthase
MNDLSKARAVLLEVDESGEGQRIDNFLMRRMKGVPKSHVYRVLRSGEVRVNSGRVRPEHRLQAGDRVRVPPVRIAEPDGGTRPARPDTPPIVHEDESILVVSKPAGLAVHGGSGVSHGLIESLRAARPDAKMLELVHRLDRETSGLLVVAKKRGALVEMHRMLREGEFRKSYLAVASGVWRGGIRDLKESLHKFVNAQGERRVSVSEEGKASRTRVKPLVLGKHCSLLEVRLMTGRTHQIRVHLAHAGHPILGDDKYGNFELNHALARGGMKRMLLHAWKLEFTHPLDGTKLALSAAPDAAFERYVAEQFPDHGG